MKYIVKPTSRFAKDIRLMKKEAIALPIKS